MTASVCYLGYELHPPWHEGTRVLTRNQLDALAAAGTHVSAVSTIGRHDARLADHAVRYVRETPVGALASRLGVDPNAIDVYLWAKLAVALRRQVADRGADLVHAGFASHSVFSLACRLPPAVPFVAQLFGKLENRTLVERLGTPRRVDAYVTCSPRDVESLRAIGVPASKIHRIPPAIPTTDGDAEAGRASLGVDADAFVVGYLGNTDLSRLPGSVARRLDAFAATPDTEVVVITKRLEQPALRDLPNLTIVERSLDEREKRDALAAGDAWLFPFAFDDPDRAPVIDPPLSVLEAMGAGRAVVATDSLSVGEYVLDGETGLLVDPGRPDDLVDRLAVLREDDAERRRVGTSARAHVAETCDPARTARMLQKVYDGVAAA